MTNFETLKPVGDVISLGMVAATLVGWLPSVAAVLAIVWTSIRIYETKTVQGWIHGKSGN